MRAITLVVIIVGAFIGVDKGFGLLNDYNAKKRQEMLEGGRDMYRIADDLLANKPGTTATTKMGAVLKRLVVKTQKLEGEFGMKYDPLNEFINQDDWLGDKAQMQQVAALAKTWANDGMKLWRKELALQKEYVSDMADLMKVSEKEAYARPIIKRSMKTFDLYKKVIDQDGRAYYGAVAKYLDFAVENYSSLNKGADGRYSWHGSNLLGQARKLNDAMIENGAALEDTVAEFMAQREAVRKDAIRSVRTAFAP